MEGLLNKDIELNRLRTELGEIQAQLAAIQEAERKISASVPGLAFVYDANQETMLYVTGNVQGALGYSPDELVEFGDRVRDELFHPEDRERLYRESEEFRRAADDDVIVSTQARIRKKDGEVRWMHLSRSVSARNDDGTVSQVVGSLSDITAQKLAERELRLTRLSVAESRDGIFWVRSDGSFHSVNKSACESLNYTNDELMGLRMSEVDVNVSPESWAQHWKEFQRGSVVQFETQVRRKDGGFFPVEISATLLFFEGEEYVFASLRDITARAEAEQKLREALEENRRLKDQFEAENVILREEIRLQHPNSEIVSTSRQMKAVMLQAEQVAGTDSTVLIQGETGTGKELMARAIHNMSNRSEGPLVAVNCAAIPESLVESELFGHEKGAFTGAYKKKIGRFEAANGGTIFLDEIGELPEEFQAKLLRALEEGQVERLGGTQTTSIDVRVIAASNRELDKEVEHGNFRRDLYYRLNVFPINLPPLRDRDGDAPVLAWRFVEQFSEKMGKNIECISRKSIEEIERYSWPGNVRELRNVIERAMIRTGGRTLVIQSPSELLVVPSKVRTLAEVEREHIVATMEQHGWKVRGDDGAAKLLGLPPTTLESRMKKLDIRRPLRRP